MIHQSHGKRKERSNPASMAIWHVLVMLLQNLNATLSCVGCWHIKSQAISIELLLKLPHENLLICLSRKHEHIIISNWLKVYERAEFTGNSNLLKILRYSPNLPLNAFLYFSGYRNEESIKGFWNSIKWSAFQLQPLIWYRSWSNIRMDGFEPSISCFQNKRIKPSFPTFCYCAFWNT